MNTTESAYRRPPGPADAVPLGIDPDTLTRLTDLAGQFGDFVAVEKPSGRLAYFINDPAAVRRLLVRQHTNYKKGPGFERVKMLLGNGLIVSDGDVWRRSRTMIQPAFKVQNIHHLIGRMVDCARQREIAWRSAAESGATINITAETSQFALDLILVCIFGDDYERYLKVDGSNRFAFLSDSAARDISVVMQVRKLRQLLLKIIAERRTVQAEQYDFLSMYLQARDKHGEPFSDNELLDELFTLIVAGFETSANTLNWCWYLLAGHREVEQELLAEIAEHVADNDSLNSDSLTSLTYTQQVLEETLRLYPPVWLFTRRSNTDDSLLDFDIPEGTDIYLSPYILHRSEHIWSDADRFEPERFALERLPKKDRPYFPFSLGPRRCLGEYFSFLEMKVHLALLLPLFRMTRTDANEPGVELAINLRSANDIILKPELRQE